MIYQIIISTLLSFVYAGCPSMCDCAGSSVTCVDKGLEYVPNFESLISNPIILDLSGNKIHNIGHTAFSFDKNKEVKEIYLNSSEIIDIDGSAFSEIENLQELYLGQNLLNTIPENLIERLNNMILLDMSNNYFSGEMPKISSKTLEVLALANCKITAVSDDALQDLPNLKLLLLQQNNIKSLSPAVFQNIKHNFFFVRLSYNSWECNCNNMELFQYLASRNFIETSEPYQCINEQKKFVNIFDKNGKISFMKDNCKTNNIVTRQLEDDFSDFKQAMMILNEAKDVDLEYQEQSSESNDFLVAQRNCNESVNSDAVLYLNPHLLVSLSVSFIFGFIMGFIFFYAAFCLRSRKLSASDSADRLITT